LSRNAIYAEKTAEMGIKVWCLSDSKSKYVYDFEIYCGRNDNGANESKNVPCVEESFATNVVLNLMNGLEGRGHVVVINNYFTSVGLMSCHYMRFMQLGRCDQGLMHTRVYHFSCPSALFMHNS
jgi:hypothetical protein